MQTWNAELYRSRHGFVSELGRDLLDLLAPRAGERVLDLGCGVGTHLQELTARGVRALGVDADPAMVAAARTVCPGVDVRVGDARELTDIEPVDAVLSNAVLHWVKPPELAARAIARVLVPGGRFVAELGGAGNIAHVREALVAMLAARGVTDGAARLPWYFPSLASYAGVLEAEGFHVQAAWSFARPTKLEGGRAGLATWLHMFAEPLLGLVPAGEQAAALSEIEQHVESALWRGDHWQLDYVRLRVLAVRP